MKIVQFVLAGLMVWSLCGVHPAPVTKRSVAHRGASSYAPEHTGAAYRLAVAHGADYVEQDLAVTKDGKLICLHDESLERTTDVEDRFPDRASTDAQGRKRWLAADFTLAEIKSLDAGSWFDQKFSGERILTFDEAIDLIGTAAGLYPELKTPALYRGRNVDIVALFAEAVKRRGLAMTLPDGRPRLVVQSFDEQAVRDLASVLPHVPRTFLIGGGAPATKWLSSPDALKEMATFATDLGPAKGLVEKTPVIVQWAHAAGLTVTPYTLGVDAVFTDNPDKFPRTPAIQ